MDPFAQELARRFAAQPVLSATARLSPVAATTARLSPVATTTTTTTTTTPSLVTPQACLGNLSLNSKPASPTPPPACDPRLTAIAPTALAPVLHTPDVLVLDLRPHATFTRSRLPHALSLSVPSTLLKRPAFSLDRLTDMLPSPSGRRRFAAWKAASRILVYDADSCAIPEGSNIRGLLRKFDSEGFRGDLAWLKGGFAGVCREARALVADGPPSPESSEDDDAPGCGVLRAKKLPSSAFQQASTTTAAQRPAPAPAPAPGPAAPAPTSTRAVPANPFYDNIRQNRELAHGITERIPLRLPAGVVARRDELPFAWLREIVDKAGADAGTDALAMQFYVVELREQRRLMGVMDHHSREAPRAGRAPFPYSITAGVEKGAKNRYTNIWPFEHARVRLNARSCEDGSDYINASHVQPLGTHRRYIATQGPLPTTYTDFWTLCWEQNIRVIVMLTRQVEGATVKCGCYWTHHTYGPLRLQLVSATDTANEPDTPRIPGFDFGPPPPADPAQATVRRTFLLSHTDHPDAPPRKVTQLQYLAWPDFDVPEDPRGLLDLMLEVDALRSEAEAETEAETEPKLEPGPLLLHCSAGIGRTGGFIMVDAALDGLRQEMRMRRKEPGPDAPAPRAREPAHTPAPMDVDASADAARRRSPARRPRGLAMRHSTGTDAGGSLPDDARTRSRSPGPSVPPDAHAHTPYASLFARPRPEPAGALSRFRSVLASARTAPPPSSAPSSAGATAGTSVPVSVESSRAPSPGRDADADADAEAFDYTDPRRLHGAGRAARLSSLADPVRSMLEDMREQRMSLCQTLRQYVFVHRAIVEGALDLVDAERARGRGGKRGASPGDAGRLSKRPSFKRR